MTGKRFDEFIHSQTVLQKTRYICLTEFSILQQNRSYQRIGAWALVLLFSAFWSLKATHVLLSHHHDEEHLVCEASHDSNSAHIHDERWANDNCSLCAFVISASESFSLLALPDFQAKLPDSAPPVGYQAPLFAKKAHDAAMRRGPPSRV